MPLDFSWTKDRKNSGNTTQNDFRRAARALVVPLALSGLLVSQTVQAEDPPYTIYSVDYPEADFTFVYGINDEGQIVGSYRGASGGYSPFVFSNGNYIPLSLPVQYSNAFAYDINNFGDIVGYYEAPTGRHGFSLIDGTFNTLDSPGAYVYLDSNYGTYAYGINDLGQISGTYVDNKGYSHGFIKTENNYTTFNFDLTPIKYNKINNKGDVVGYSFSRNDGYVPFVRHADGSFSRLPQPATWPEASGINDAGDTAGALGYPYDSYVYSQGQFTTLKSPASTLASSFGIKAFDINNNGMVAGTYADRTPQGNSITSGFVTSPITEKPPLTILQAAQLSQSLYEDFHFTEDNSVFGVDDFLSIKEYKTENGFRAAVFSNPDHSQIVISFRGTILSLKNATADIGIGLSYSATLNEYLLEAAQIIQTIAGDNPEAKIILTGHSLGGAVAQLMGNGTGLRVYAFDAPGTLQLRRNASVQEILSTLPRLGTGGNNVNYRLYGDQVSLLGIPIGQLMTIGNSGGPTSELDVFGILDAHSIDNMVTALSAANSPFIQMPGALGPNYADFITDKMIYPNNLLTTGVQGFTAVVGALSHVLVDPDSYSRFILTLDEGSPYLNSVALPYLDGVVSYNFSFKTGNSWSIFQPLQPGQTFTFGDGVNGIEFGALDAVGKPISTPSDFWFDLTFSSSGTFSGRLQQLPPPAVPLPPAAYMFGAGLAALGGLLDAIGLVVLRRL